jgi:hypothetical protein
MSAGSAAAAASDIASPDGAPTTPVPAVGKTARKAAVGDQSPEDLHDGERGEPDGPLTPEKRILPEIQRLKAQQKEMVEAKKKIQKELKNAERRRARLKRRARQLTDEDLIAVVALRAGEKAAKVDSAVPAVSGASPSSGPAAS